MTKKEKLTIEKYEKFVFENNPSTDFLVEIFKLSGNYLNLQTISNYAKSHNKSYEGVKRFRNIKEIFGVKFVIDNK